MSTIAKIFAGVAIALCFTARAAAEENRTAFVNVSVIPMDGRGVLENRTVIVEGDRITDMTGDANALSPSDDTNIIDGAGKYLIPGMGEMHGHIPPLSQGDQAVNDTLFLYLSNGVTTVRGMLGSIGQLELRDDANTGARLSPTLYLAGPSFNGNSISSPQQARARAKAQADAGWDLLKVHPGLTRAEYDAMAGGAKEAGIDFAGHVPSDVGLARALEAGQRTFDHIDGYIAYLGGDEEAVDEDAMRAIARKTRDAGAGIVPTSALWATFLGDFDKAAMFARPELKYIPAATVEGWTNSANSVTQTGPSVHNENRRRLLKVMQAEGVEILFGTDAPQVFSVPGFSIHHEIAEMAAAGLSPEAILISATANVGAYFDDKDAFGVIAPNMRADLVLLDGNPLDDLENLKDPAGVMVRGRWIDRAEIDERLAEIEARAKN